MNKQDMEKYKIASEVTTSECYTGMKDCGSCMHAFPGSYSLDLTSTDCDESEKKYLYDVQKVKMEGKKTGYSDPSFLVLPCTRYSQRTKTDHLQNTRKPL